MKLISIIIPVYKVEIYIRKCLDSVLNQTYRNIEIILIDDGSPDSSGQICDEYAKTDSRIKVIHKKNEGVANARITGFNYSNGELITFIDSDDYVDSHYIEKLIAPFEKYDIDLSTCEYYEEREGVIKHPKRTVHGYLSRKDIDQMLASQYLFDPKLGYAGLPIFLVTKLIKRKFVGEALKKGIGLWWGEDQIASFYIFTSINAMYALQEPLYYYVQHEGQVTKSYKSSLWNNQFECWNRYKILDYKQLLDHQLPLRMWWTIKQNFKKMINYGISYHEFRKEMNQIDNNGTWKELLNNKNLSLNPKERFVFFLLRNSFYYPLYNILSYVFH